MKAYVKLKGPGILSDMYAYVMAAAHLQLPHTLFDHFMVSCVDCRGEGWPWVDVNAHDACADPFGVPAKTPVILHYCHNYNVGNTEAPMFHKGHVPPNILDCDQPAIIEPPKDFQAKQTTEHNKRSAWMTCMIISRLNNALEAYKSKFCDKHDNTKRFRIKHEHISNTCRDGKTSTEGKTCWVYADKMAPDWTWPKKSL